MVDSFSRRRYVLAALLTALVFSLGLFLGLFVEGQRVDFIQQQSYEQALDFSSLQLQYEYIDQLAQEGNCEALASSFDKNINTLESTRNRLENYYQSAQANRDDFQSIRREYTLAQLNYWLFSKKYEDLCNTDSVTILFFYEDTADCTNCDDQGFVLSYYKGIFQDSLLNFAIDAEGTDEPMIDILKSTYNITSYPSLVVQDTKYEGFVGRDELRDIICSEFSTSHDVCTE